MASRSPELRQARPGRRFAALFAVSVLLLLAAGYWYYRGERQRLYSEQGAILAYFSGLKSIQIHQWQRERLADTRRVADGPFVRRELAALLHDPGAGERAALLKERLRTELMKQKYAAALLFAPDGRILFSTDEAPSPPGPATRRALATALTGREAVLSDFFSRPDGGVAVDAAAVARDIDGRPLAVVVLRSNVATQLSPLIDSLPLVRPSAEILLAQRENDEVVFLIERSDRAERAPLTARVPLSRTEMPVVQAALGRRGAFGGRDYRGVEVLADLSSIPDSSWFAVTKVDADEIRAEARSRAIYIGALIGLFILLAGAVTAWRYRQREVGLLRDLCASERQRRETEEEHRAAMSVSEERLRLALAAASQGLYDLNLQTGEWVVSPEYASMLGHDPAEFRETCAAWRARLHPDDREEAIRAYEDCVAGLRDGFDVEFRQRTRSGDWKWICSRGSVVSSSAEGRPLRLLGTSADITERKRADEALTLFRTLVDRSSDAIEVIDPETGRFLDVNERGCLDLGYSREEVLTLSVPDVDPTVDQSTFAESMEQLRRSGHLLWEGIHRRKDGSTFPVEVNIKLIQLDRNYLVTVARDITERKQAEAHLRMQSAALNAAADSIAITDRSGVIECVNPAFTALTGCGDEDAIGRNFLDLVGSGVPDQAGSTALWATVLAEQPWHGELTYRRNDGSLHPLALTITPVQDAGGEVTHVIAIGRDLTDQKRLEAQLLHAQKMEVVGRLAGGIAHDFNNLLTVINGTAELALVDLSDADPLRTDLLEIQQAGNRAAALTSQLLTFSRKQTLKPEVLHPGTVVGNMQDLLQSLLGDDIELVVVQAGESGWISADSAQIEQVILNLATNARDAMPAGGTLTIEARDVELDEAFAAGHPSVAPGRYVAMSISDTGVGMDEATRRRVFEPFFTTKEPGKGTGLGLSTAYGAVTQSGGTIVVDSEHGVGTTFTIYLPRVETVAEGDRPARMLMVAPCTETILLADDEVAVRHLAARMLRAAGYTVLTADSGANALLLLERHDGPVHLLLTDLVMPGMGGRDLADRARQLRRGLRLLFMSGYSAGLAVRDVLNSGASLLRKPFTAESLARAVRAVLDEPEARR